MFLEKDTSPLWATHLAWLLLIFLGPSSCGAPEVATDLTGLRITVHYDSALGIDQLLVVGRMGGATIFGPDLLPKSATGDLSPEGESVVVLLPVSFSGGSVTLRVDGIKEGQVVGTIGGSVLVVANQIVDVLITLEAPVRCGDGTVSSELEGCDDGNATAGDGCSVDCLVEAGFTCQGAPSVCITACTDDSQCSPLCDLRTGTCVADMDITFVDCGSQQCPGSGTQTSPYCSLQSAVSATPAGLFILIAAGTCTESVTLSSDRHLVATPGATLRSGSCPAIRITGKTVTIRGLTVTGADPTHGGGIAVENGGSLELTQSIVGPGECIGVDCSGASCTIDRTTITGNEGGGVRINDSSYTLESNVIVKNGKTSHDGSWGGVSIDAAGATVARFVNNTVAGNLTREYSGDIGGVHCLSHATLVNSILWQNAGDEVSEDCSLTYCDVSQGWFAGGSGNLNRDPLFENPAAGDYRLQAGSPCIDAADPVGVPPAPPWDLDGDTRPTGSRVDIGADERL